MKKIFAYFVITALAVSCNIVPEPDVVLQGEGDTLELSAWCTSPQTRANGTMYGEDAYNENALTSIDYFIYPSNASKDTPAVMHDRWTLSTTDHASKVVNMSDYKKTYGTSGKVFMVANMPKTGEEDPFKGTESVNEILALPVPVTTFEQVNNGKFKAQDSFVMISEDWEGFTLQQNASVKVTVPLSRRAAKITLDIKAANWFVEYHYNEDKVHGTYVQTWYPNLDNIQVYLLNFTNEGTMDGTPINVSEKFRFKSYQRRAYTSTIDNENEYMIPVDSQNDVAAKLVTGNPFYSYPSVWQSKDVNAPFIKIILEWSAYEEDTIPTSTVTGDKKTLKQPNKEFYYKITIPDELDLKSNNWYMINLDLSVLGSEADDAYVTIPGKYSIVAWSDPDDAMGGDLNSGRYLTVGGNKTQVKEGNIVYETFVAYSDKVEIPIITSHPFEIVNTNTSKPDASFKTFRSPYNNGTLTYTSGNNASAIGNNYKITPSADFTYLTLEHERVKSVEDFTVTGTGDNARGNNSKDVAPITYSFEIQHSDDPSYHRYIRVIQYPAIYINQYDGGNVFVDGRFYYQTNAPFSGLTRRNYSFNNKTPGYSGEGYNSENNATTNYPSALSTPYGSIRYDGGNPQKMTLVTVTAFTSGAESYTVSVRGANAQTTTTETYDYIIGDPRQKTPWNGLEPYLSGRGGATTPWSNVSDIQIGSRTNKNIIAPAFLISSRWGRPGGTFLSSLEDAEKRCATYQEAGFPAGRWRLPTEAEIYFVYSLQGKKLMDDLFSGDSGNYGYFASSGRVFDRQTNSFGGAGKFWDHYGSGSTNTISVRCVYDYWYWGAESQQANQNKFYPSPTQTVVAGY